MKPFEQLTKTIIDDLDQGIIFIDKTEAVQNINQRAKEILGITTDYTHSHPKGKIEVGDIVIIADNLMGFDDGGMTAKDLSYINIYDSTICKDDIFIGIGVYGNEEISPVYKHLPSNEFTEDISISTEYLGFKITAGIRPSEKLIFIEIDGNEYQLNYMKSSAHMVIIDNQNGHVKFFQTRGYSIRKEYIRDILLGRPFLAKGQDSNEINPIGKRIENIIEYGELVNLVRKVLRRELPSVLNEFHYINNIMTLCSISPIETDNHISGALIKIIDVAELQSLIELRNNTIQKVEQAYESLQKKTPQIPTVCFENIWGNSDAIRKVKYMAYKAAQVGSNVIITGDSGTGKTHLAYEIHKLHKGETFPFVEVNCSSISHNLFESELFGYVGGAFTGALNKGKIGFFELANKGTIFLDEIGEIPLEMQAKLLHVLQSKRIYRVGSSQPIDIDVRVITATNKNLADEVQKGTFRQDLFFRLNVFPINIPSLVHRKTDIYILANKILHNICNSYNLPVKQLSGSALAKLIDYEWPGNIRELENVLERAVTICDSEIIFPEFIDIDVDTSGIVPTLKEAVYAAERKVIIDTLHYFNGDKSKAIESLDISKAGFYEKIKKYNIKI